MLMQTVMITLWLQAPARDLSLTDVLLSGCLLLLSFVLARVWILTGDVRALSVVISGERGTNGMASTQRQHTRILDRHTRQIVRLESHANLDSHMDRDDE